MEKTKPTSEYPEKRSVRSAISTVYTSIIGGITLVLPETGLMKYSAGEFFGFFAALLLFFASYLIEFFNTPFINKKQAVYFRFFFRMILLEILLSTSPSPFLILLYPIIIFSAYFLFSKKVIAFLTLGYILGSMYRSSLIEIMWYYNSIFLTNLILISALLILAYFINEDDKNHKKTGELLSDLKESRDRLVIYSKEVAELSASEERNKIARDIHDSLGHYLTSIVIQLEKAEAYRERDEIEANEAVSSAKLAAQDALNDIRKSVSLLRDNSAHFCLLESVEKLINELNLDVDFTFEGEEKSFSPFSLMTIFKAVQEGLTNVVKHSGQKKAILIINLNETRGTMRLSDSGKGFDITNNNKQYHYGLIGIKERAELIHGKVEIESLPDKGLTLNLTVPRNPEKIISDNGSLL